MYKYYFISIDEWFIAENKQEFLLDFLEHINNLEEEKAEKNNDSNNNKTSTYIRSRPRRFRISSQEGLIKWSIAAILNIIFTT